VGRLALAEQVGVKLHKEKEKRGRARPAEKKRAKGALMF
jgi:hypothetical protein